MTKNSFVAEVTFNKFANQKKACVASTWINVSAAMALLTTLLLDFNGIDEETLFSPAR